jgi:hypothetical protein
MPVMRRREFLTTLIGAVVAGEGCAAITAASGPSVTMLIRHGEDVGQRDFHLSPKGVQRAAALPKLFGPKLPKPDVIIAAHASKESNRPFETVEPLARELRLPIDTRFRDDDFRLLAHELLNDPYYDGKVVLVCWHHTKIPKLARALGVMRAPAWPDNQFDHVWVIERTDRRSRLKDVHQKLLDGDS